MATQKIICDTDVLIEFFDESKSRHSTTATTIEKIGINNILISAISKMELIKGTQPTGRQEVKKIGHYPFESGNNHSNNRTIKYLSS